MSHGETIAEMVRVVLASDTLREAVLSELDLTDKAAKEAAKKVGKAAGKAATKAGQAADYIDKKTTQGLAVITGDKFAQSKTGQVMVHAATDFVIPGKGWVDAARGTKAGWDWIKKKVVKSSTNVAEIDKN